MTNPRHILATIIAVILAAAVMPAMAENRVGRVGYNWLQDSLKNPRRKEIMLATLAATGDKDLTGIFVALSKSSDKRKRLFATKALGNIGGKDVIEALIQRVQTDPAMVVRAEALALLLDMKAAPTAVLAQAINIDDEGIKSIAARMLAKRTGNAKAIEILKQLTESEDPLTSSMAKMSLLASGYKEYYSELSKTMLESKADPALLRLLLMHISEEKVTAAAPLAKRLISDTSKSLAIRILACQALSKSSPTASKVLFKALRKALKKTKIDQVDSKVRDQVVFRVSVLRILAERKDSRKYLRAIAKSKYKLPFVTLGRFELARRSKTLPRDKAEKAEKAVDAAMRIDQPIATNYVLLRARNDAKKLGKKADFYTPAMLGYLKRIDPYSRQLSAEHRLATQAANWLADIGTPRAMSGLASILSGRYSAIKRCAAAGLIATKNHKATELAAKLLDSPYPEIATDGALVLGRLGDKRGRRGLRELVQRDDGRNELAALASWYLVKINGQTQATVKALAKNAR